mmetsp:Transcript_23377/g.46923  ORF Transcript_23377/g.46923 Transcript_23377/m.46923 type:complete len:783 (-) Transcript_23377:32-2380(-)
MANIITKKDIMAIDRDTNNDSRADARQDAATKGTSEIIHRKRRLSKRERKNLKKQKANLDVPPIDIYGSSSGSTGVVQEKSDGKSIEPSKNALNNKNSEPTLEEYLQNYNPAPPVKIAIESNIDSKSLGKWFPKASVIKSSVCYSNDYLVKLEKDRKKAQNIDGQQQQQQTNRMKKKKNKEENNEDQGDSTTETSTTGKQQHNNQQQQQQITIQDLPKEPKASLVLFYQYVNPPWSQAKVSSLLTYLTNIAKTHRPNIGGRIRISTEGVNATVSAASTEESNKSDSDIDPKFEAAQTIRHFTEDLRNFDPVRFAETDFKFIDDLSADRHFKELKLIPVKELVFYGIREEDCALNGGKSAGGGSNASDGKDGKDGPASGVAVGGAPGTKEARGGIHLDAKDYHEMLKRKDAVVIDVRNHYEAAIGRFDGQMEGDRSDASVEEKNGAAEKAKKGGAEYIDPKMRKSTDFTSWLEDSQTKEKLENKTVLMFCTGGIRCERASAYLNSKMGEKVKGVYQLQGGIERYLQAFPEGGFWRGKNFVFDKREAIGAGNVNGDGGVIRKEDEENAKKSKKDGKCGNNKLLSWGTECAKCKKPWDRYVGKRKCYTCGVPVLVCDTCMSQSSTLRRKKRNKSIDSEMDSNEGNKEKSDGSKNKKFNPEEDRVRCPLCIEEGVTVPAEDVEFTDNGIRGRCRTSSFSEGGIEEDFGAPYQEKSKPTDNNADVGKKVEVAKAAKSVLKWGGGHAAKKKEMRKFSRKRCQFGDECVRKNCYFYHPEREMNCKPVRG